MTYRYFAQLFVVLCCACLVIWPYTACAQEPFDPAWEKLQTTPAQDRTVLFSLPFGGKWPQLGASWPAKNATEATWEFPAGPTGIEVKGGRVYIADVVNGCIKWFSLSGRFQGKTPTFKEIMEYFAVAKDGTVYTLTQDSNDGELIVRSFSAQGKQNWQVRQYDVTSPSWGLRFTRLFPLSDGQVGVQMSKNLYEIRLAVINNEGNWRYTLPVEAGDEAGRFYREDEQAKQKLSPKARQWSSPLLVYHLPPEVEQALSSKAEHNAATSSLNANGTNRAMRPKAALEELQSVGQFALTSPFLNKTPQEDTGGVVKHLYGSDGSYLLLAMVFRRKTNGVEDLLRINATDRLALVFDSSGKLQKATRFFDLPFVGTQKEAAIDENGDFYALEMTLKGFDVVRYRLKKPAS